MCLGGRTKLDYSVNGANNTIRYFWTNVELLFGKIQILGGRTVKGIRRDSQGG